MKSAIASVGFAALAAAASDTILTDISAISKYWGQMSPYHDNDPSYFGVEYAGLPDGCQIEQVHSLQRHAQRFPISGGDDDGDNDIRFAQKLSNFTSANTNASFSGPLEFLNTYKYIMDSSGLLTGLGAATEFSSGVSFWNRYGRTLYSASTAQLYYTPDLADGTARRKPVLRTTSQSRIQNSQISWSLGFFGPSYQITPNPSIWNYMEEFDLVIIPEGGTENNTLASYDSCTNEYSDDVGIGYLGDEDLFTYIPKYLANATARLQQYAPKGFTFTTNDTYAFQSICAYENCYIGESDFCTFFTEDEWSGFENTLDMIYFYDYSYGNPTGRAQGLGYVQELLARLTSQYITVSNSSVNSTLDNNAATFPLNEPFYLDFSHDDVIVSALTALSMDYFKDPPSLTQYPPSPDRHFVLSNMTPFGARLITEVIGCTSPTPAPVKKFRTNYTPTEYGYNAASATNKFIRMRLNNGILPLNTLRSGLCGNSTNGTGRPDGMCDLSDFVQSAYEAEKLANYEYACFGNYTVVDGTSGKDWDGTIFEE